MDAHYLPRCYLSGFVDPTPVDPPRTQSLWVFAPGKLMPKRRAPHNVATKPDYYATTRADGGKDQSRENALAEVEGATAPILRQLSPFNAITPEQAATLVLFAGTMLLRAPRVHEDLEQAVLSPQVMQLLEANRKRLREDPEALRASLEACARATGDARVLSLQVHDFDRPVGSIRLNREFVVDRAFVNGPAILRVLAQMRWRLLRSTPRFFVTSDRPVHVIDPEAEGNARHGLLSSGAMFTLPLTREVLLLGDWRGPAEMSWAGITEAGVRDMNLRRAAPDACIYSPEERFLGLEELKDASG